jgi:catechol 2,3-dioxygenase-like lactoylglutathione lyase family enzyme
VSAQSLACIALLVRDYEEALAFYVGILGFELVEDRPVPEQGKRWVVVRPRGGGCALLLARASTPAQRAAIGNQTGGRVFLFLHTDDFDRDHLAWTARGVRFREAPREEAYGRVAVFEDLYGNAWDLVQARGSAAAAG